MSETTRKRSRGRLVEMTNRLSYIISTCIIVIVTLAAIVVMVSFILRDMQSTSQKTADEIRSLLVVPLYNMDDSQVFRIGEALTYSGEISGITIYSTASGIVYDKKPSVNSNWIAPLTRNITYQNIDLGRVDVYFSGAQLQGVVEGFLITMAIVIAAVLLANSLINRKVISRSQRVFDRLIERIGEIGAGHYDARLEETGYEDIDAVVGVMNDMAKKIESKNAELLAINQTLERRVARRTAELESALAEQKLLQERLIDSGKLMALGQLSAGIAHELNTPLGAIISANGTLTDFLDKRLPKLGEYRSGLTETERGLFDAILESGLAKNRELETMFPGRKQVKDLQESLAQAGVVDAESLAEKFAEIGIVDGLEGIAPLLNDPRAQELASVAGEAAISRRMVEIIRESAHKAASVVSALRSYLSPEQADAEAIVEVDRDLLRVLTLMHNMLKHGITVTTELEPVRVIGSSDRLSQVWMNLIRNAAQAMEYSGALLIRAVKSEGRVIVSVIDSGPGVPLEIRDKIFQPFFTTKKQGEGLGLGLDICRKIVESARGSITLESRPGRTEFRVNLPAAPEPMGEREAKNG